MKLLALLFPFVFAIGLIAIGPLVSDKIKGFEIAYYRLKFAELNLAEHVDAETSEESIAELTQYLMDAYQWVALTMAPAVGVITAFPEVRLHWWAMLVYLAVALVGFFGFIRMLKDAAAVDPEKYFRESGLKIGKYSPVSVLGFAVNTLALVVVSLIYLLS
ncbi:hypothetical protein [Streptomyces sp. NBC_00829]|uniref:hypothetical protein n=1 Tax=Streptomyces sp. NBC_00829 TaxID=2903679 RepID=UPI002F91AF45|nr:hypothetical protein OG293_39670 [Streptomyces sp. NBC_00829]